MAKLKQPLTNNCMVELAQLRVKSRHQQERIKELERYLARAINEIETLSAQYDDTGSKMLTERLNEVLNNGNNQ